jgi:hypothetical protein
MKLRADVPTIWKQNHYKHDHVYSEGEKESVNLFISVGVFAVKLQVYHLISIYVIQIKLATSSSIFLWPPGEKSSRSPFWSRLSLRKKKRIPLDYRVEMTWKLDTL